MMVNKKMSLVSESSRSPQTDAPWGFIITSLIAVADSRLNLVMMIFRAVITGVTVVSVVLCALTGTANALLNPRRRGVS